LLIFILSTGECAGPSYGVIQAWWSFSDNGSFLNYREDAVISESPIVYNREYLNYTDQFEFFLFGNNASTLTCFHAGTGGVNIDRYFMVNGSGYVDTRVYYGVEVYRYEGTWGLHHKSIPVWGLVRTDNFDIFGWESGGVVYIYWDVQVLPGRLNESFWIPPTTPSKCISPGPSREISAHPLQKIYF